MLQQMVLVKCGTAGGNGFNVKHVRKGPTLTVQITMGVCLNKTEHCSWNYCVYIYQNTL